MRDGEYTYYAIEWQLTAENEWGLPRSDFIPVDGKDEWHKADLAVWGGSLSPHVGRPTGNLWHPSDSAADAEMLSVARATGGCGWWTERLAFEALRRLRTDDSNGKYDAIDVVTRRLMQRRRHRFRVIKVSVSKRTLVVEEQSKYRPAFYCKIKAS